MQYEREAPGPPVRSCHISLTTCQQWQLDKVDDRRMDAHDFSSQPGMLEAGHEVCEGPIFASIPWAVLGASCLHFNKDAVFGYLSGLQFCMSPNEVCSMPGIQYRPQPQRVCYAESWITDIAHSYSKEAEIKMSIANAFHHLAGET